MNISASQKLNLMIKKMKLGSKFTLVLTLVFLGGIVLSGIILSGAMQHKAEEVITAKAELLTQMMNSVRSYTSDRIAPLLEDRQATHPEFIRESVPAFGARAVFEQFRDRRPEYKSFFYKEATLNPTNRKDQADEFEVDLVNQFRSQIHLTELTGYRSNQGNDLFYLARPMAVTQASCLNCHGNPSLAPKNMSLVYGTQGGFNWKLNEIVAAQMIYVPADEVLIQGRQYLALVMGVFVSIFAVVVLIINSLLKQAVIHPIKQLTAIARKVSTGTMTAEQVEAFDAPNITQVAQRSDEPGQLARAFQQMAHEVAAREQNLAQSVEDRTLQLAKSMEEAEKARAKSEAANQTKSQFLSHMSHELRTPLNVILGFTQLLTRSGSLKHQQQEYLDTISRSGEHLLTLIDDVLEMSKIEAGRMTFNENCFDLLNLLDSLQQMLRLKAEFKGLRLIFELEPHLPEYICTDESKLRQVLMNLLGNALKFTQVGSVTLRVSEEDSPISLEGTQTLPSSFSSSSLLNLCFEIEDTGPGIAPSELDSLFEAFVQTKTGRHSQEGTGLGLPISQKFVRLMGGEIGVSSQLGVGTTFKFNIWAHRTVEPLEKRAQSTYEQVIGLEMAQPNYRILVVEDKRENLQLLVDLLTSVGFDVQEATNGQEAIAIWQNWSPHLIWMDMRMPVMDGYEATRLIKAEGSPSPIIIALSGSAFEEDRIVALSMGCDDFVRKPFRAEMIFAKMADYLGVRYCYGSSPAPDPLSPRSPILSQSLMLPPHELAQGLARMPVDWVAQLHNAATRVNGKQMSELLKQIPQSDQPLVNALTFLIDNFRFEEIVALTQKIR